MLKLLIEAEFYSSNLYNFLLFTFEVLSLK